MPDCEMEIARRSAPREASANSLLSHALTLAATLVRELLLLQNVYRSGESSRYAPTSQARRESPAFGALNPASPVAVVEARDGRHVAVTGTGDRRHAGRNHVDRRSPLFGVALRAGVYQRRTCRNRTGGGLAT